MTSPHVHLPSLPPLFPPILFTISLLHPRHLSSHSPYRRLPLANSPPVLLSFSFPISSLTPSSLPPSPPPLLPLFPREDWLANLAVYPQCLVVSRRRGQLTQHEDTSERQLRNLKRSWVGKCQNGEENKKWKIGLVFFFNLDKGTTWGLSVCVNS